MKNYQYRVDIDQEWIFSFQSQKSIICWTDLSYLIENQRESYKLSKTICSRIGYMKDGD